MGRLAERYRDASRSGVYRVTEGTVAQAAALEAGLKLARLAISHGADMRAQMRERLGIQTQVLIIEGLDALPASRSEEWRAVLTLLDSTASARRALGTPFFAVFVDPQGLLDLPILYRETRS